MSTESERDGYARPGRLREPAGALLIVSAAALVFWPALRGFLIDDDFLLLAFARVLRDPLALFAHEHFSIGPYFRPLSMALWWVSAQCFGNAVTPQYAVNLGLHAVVSLILWRLMRSLSSAPGPSFALTMIFAVHPLAVGTAAWLADRFDLLCTLFALLAFAAALADRRQPRAGIGRLLGTAVLCSLALLAKETGIAAIVAVAFLWSAPGQDASLRRRRIAAAGLMLGTAVWVAWRAHVAHSLPLPYEDVPFATLLLRGAGRWAVELCDNLSGWGRMPTVGRVVLLVAAGLIAVAAFARRREWRALFADPETRTVTTAAGLAILAAAALQAPVADTWRVVYAPTTDANAIVSNSRLFYLPLCLLLLVAARLAGRVRTSRVPNLAGYFAVALAAVAWGWQAHALANDFRRRTILPRAQMRAAALAVERAAPRAGRCQIYLLGIDDGKEINALKTLPDSVVKALVRDVHPIERCLIQSEQASWLNIVGGQPLPAEGMPPLVPVSGAHGRLPWLEVGGVQVAYLNIAAGADAMRLTDAVFLAAQREGFIDVGDDVRSGRRPLRFVCARTPAQCRGGDGSALPQR